MKKTIKSASLFMLLLLLATLYSCNSGATENPSEKVEEPKSISFEEYIGTYDIIETKDNRQCRVFMQKDSLYLHSYDIGDSKMIAEKNEVFDVPGHETRMRFMRDKAGDVDRVILLTKRGRFTGMKVKEQ